MTQSALTVTAPNPTPPTNFSSVGVTGPNPPNYTKNSYANPFNMSAINTPQLVGDGRPVQTIPGVGVNQSPPPYFDDGTAGALTTFAANTAALASGTGATSGGTEGTFPGTGSGSPPPLNLQGAVPASTSLAHEGAGDNNVVVTAPGSRAECPTQSFSCGPNRTVGVLPTPNASHASSLSPTTNPTLTSITPGSTVSGAGNTTLTATGVGFTKQSVVVVNGVPQATVFASSTSLTCAAVPKKATAGAWPVIVVTGGVVETAPQTWTFT